MNGICNVTVTQKFLFQIPASIQFFLHGKILSHFEIILHIWSINLLFHLDIPVMVNILFKMIKTLHEKMLKAIFFY